MAEERRRREAKKFTRRVEGNREPEGFPAAHRLETFGGPIQVLWEADGGLSMYGPLTYVIEFLKVSGVWELRYPSRKRPKVHIWTG